MSQRKKWKIQPALDHGGPLSDRANPWEMTQTRQSARKAPRLSLPSFPQCESPDPRERGALLTVPHSSHAPFEFTATQVAEY